MIRGAKQLRVLIFLLLPSLLAGCTAPSFPEELREEQAAAIAIPYFLSQHGLETSVERTQYVRIGDRSYQNLITVRASDGTLYELRLDGRNAPQTDNVLCVQRIAALGMTSLLGRPCEIAPEYSRSAYRSVCTVRSPGSPDTIDPDELFAALRSLKEAGIEYLDLLIHTPDFLMPPVGHGLQLGAGRFETDLDRDSFLSQYTKWIRQVFWDEQKFQAVKETLLTMGAVDGYFCLESRYTRKSVTITLYWEGDTPLSRAQENRLLRQLEDGCIRLGDRRITFRIQQK